MMKLNGALVTERRLDLGYSESRLARLLAVGAPVIKRLEAGENHGDLTWQTICRLCEVLAIDPAGLAAGPVREPAAATPDDVAVEAALAQAGRRLTGQELARGLKWPLERVQSAIDRLRRRLEQTGVRLNYNGGRYSLWPAAGILTSDQVEGIERAYVENAHITTHEARVLRQVIDGRVDDVWLTRATAAQKPVLARLLRLGWIERRGTRFLPTEAARHSLLIARRPDDQVGETDPRHT
jgi:transcriptional regulator with XRE-family HTH domain